jgi:hypothetical protein
LARHEPALVEAVATRIVRIAGVAPVAVGADGERADGDR